MTYLCLLNASDCNQIQELFTINHNQTVGLYSGLQPVMQFLGVFFSKCLVAIGFYDSRHIRMQVGGVSIHLYYSLECEFANLREE